MQQATLEERELEDSPLPEVPRVLPRMLPAQVGSPMTAADVDRLSARLAADVTQKLQTQAVTPPNVMPRAMAAPPPVATSFAATPRIPRPARRVASLVQQSKV